MKKFLVFICALVLTLSCIACSSTASEETSESVETPPNSDTVAGEPMIPPKEESNGIEVSEDTSSDDGEYLVTETGHCYHYATCWTIEDSENLVAYSFDGLPFDQDACRFCKPPMNGVWVTDGEGTEHYHNYKCEHTKDSPSVHKVEVQKALDRGLTPCPDCNPW